MGCHLRLAIVSLPAVLQLPHCSMALFLSPRWVDYKVKLYCRTSVPGVCSNNSKCYYFLKKTDRDVERKQGATERPDIATVYVVWAGSA